jgi:hypothetical protein
MAGWCEQVLGWPPGNLRYGGIPEDMTCELKPRPIIILSEGYRAGE